MSYRTAFCAALAGVALSAAPALAQEEAPPLLQGNFSFEGIFGTIDMASAQRGLQIYKEVCSACHGLYELHYSDLKGLGYNDDQVKAFAAQYQVADINGNGDPIQRPAKPSDYFVRPFANDLAARAANNGAAPPDLALIVKSRAGGANYPYSILQGYGTPPSDVKMAAGMNYNKYFPGHQIAMPQPLQDGAVTFADGTPNNLAQEAKDVSTFLEWAANPELDRRKELGVRAVLFLLLLAGVLYAAKLKIWRDLH